MDTPIGGHYRSLADALLMIFSSSLLYPSFQLTLVPYYRPMIETPKPPSGSTVVGAWLGLGLMRHACLRGDPF